MIAPSTSKKKTFIDLFPAPEFLLLSTAGISITDSDTKFIQLRRELFGDGFKLTRSLRIDNPPGAIESGVIANLKEMVPVLKELASTYGIRYVHATLPEEKAYLFTTTIPWVPREGLQDAVAFIVEENVPITLAESVFDFEVISEDKRAGEIKVAVSVLPKNIVNSYVELFESAGIIPISFDIESQATTRAVIYRGDKRTILIINISFDRTGFYVVEDGVVQFSTAPAYGIGQDESYSSLNDLKAEMHKVFAFWNTRINKTGTPVKKIEKILLCGIGASKKDFVDKLMSESEVKYDLADVWANTSPHGHVLRAPFDKSLDYAATIGLVLPRQL